MSHIKPRPFHPKSNPLKQRAFRDGFQEIALERAPEGIDRRRVEIRFQDEARAGRQGMTTRIWAPTGSRPRVVRDHRYGCAYLFAAARCEDPVAVGHVCPRANAGELSRHLRGISGEVAPGRHAVVVLDGAGWHRAKALEIPGNVSLLHLPPQSPEPDPVEQVFGCIRSNFLSNRVFKAVEDVHAALEAAWKAFASDTERIASIMARNWARIAP